MITKYEVISFSVETTDGTNAAEEWNKSVDQDFKTLASFDDKEEALKFYATVETGISDYGRYFLHSCKAIVENEYEMNDDGELEWVGDGDTWEEDIPEVCPIRVYDYMIENGMVNGNLFTFKTDYYICTVRIKDKNGDIADDWYNVLDFDYGYSVVDKAGKKVPYVRFILNGIFGFRR